MTGPADTRPDQGAPEGSRGWRSLFPILSWLPAYDRRLLAGDAGAAAIVTVMLVPQSLAYAMLAGLPPETGLYASILPLFLYTIFGTSGSLAVGPVAVISLMTAAAAGAVAEAGSAEYRMAAVTLALLSGAILLSMALLRLGRFAGLLSPAVVCGFTAAAGLLIAAGQMRHVLGIPLPGDTLPDLLAAMGAGIGGLNVYTTGLGAGCLTFLVWSRQRAKPLLRRLGVSPWAADLAARASPLLAIGMAIGAVLLFGLEDRGVPVVGGIPPGMPRFGVPSLDPTLCLQLLAPAALISLVGYIESLSIAQTLAARAQGSVRENQELVALGAANVASAVSGSFPITGGLARSAVNADAGARTPMAGTLTAAGIAAASFTIAPLLQHLPQSVLAATIIVAVLSLVDPGAMKATFRRSRRDAAVMTATMAGVLCLGVETGLAAGLGMSLLVERQAFRTVFGRLA